MTAQDQLDAKMRHRLTVAEFLLLDREGAFDHRNVELFDGEVYYIAPKYRPHARVLGDVYHSLRIGLANSEPGLGALVDISIPLSDHDVLEPDIAVTSEPEGEGLLPAASVRLVIEISDSTLARDLGVKAGIYAQAGIPEYWVFDLNERRVLMHTNPREDPSGYDGQLDVPFGKSLQATTIEGLTVKTDALR